MVLQPSSFKDFEVNCNSAVIDKDNLGHLTDRQQTDSIVRPFYERRFLTFPIKCKLYLEIDLVLAFFALLEFESQHIMPFYIKIYR